MLPTDDLAAGLLSPPGEIVAARALEHFASMDRQMRCNPITLGFDSRDLEGAYATYRAALAGEALRAGLLWLACAYVALEVALEAWAYSRAHVVAHFAWAFALAASSALVGAFWASQGDGRHADAIGAALLVVLACALMGRAAFMREDPLAPPVALGLLFFAGAGPALVQLRFVAMGATLAPLAAAHAVARLQRPTEATYAGWYEAGAVLLGLLSALACRRLEHDQRREFFLLAAMSADGCAELPPGGALVTAVQTRITPLDEALRELRELAHRVQLHLPHARVPTDVVERALGESGASTLAELLLRGSGGGGGASGARAQRAHDGAHEGGSEAGAYAPPPLEAVGVGARPPSADACELGDDRGGRALADGADGRDARPADADAWARIAAARAAGAPVRLVRSDELPAYFAPYAHVLGGYRCELSAAQCVRSLFEWHNETLNVWTELLPAALFAGAIARLLRAESVRQMDAVDRGLLAAGLVVALLVRPLCSAAAHLLYCATERRLYALWWSVDYVSICLAILAVSLVCARNAFYCEPELAHLFFVCSSGLLCTSMIAVLCTASSAVRAFSFLLFVLFCNVVPLCYTLLSKLDGWYHNDAPWAYIYSWVGSLLVFWLGMVIKSTSVPEACAPGAFDLVGSSHQLWHVCINVAFVFGTLVPWRIYADWRATAPCPAQPNYFGLGLGGGGGGGGGGGWAT